MPHLKSDHNKDNTEGLVRYSYTEADSFESGAIALLPA
jgi:hypothetical protein